MGMTSPNPSRPQVADRGHWSRTTRGTQKRRRIRTALPSGKSSRITGNGKRRGVPLVVLDQCLPPIRRPGYPCPSLARRQVESDTGRGRPVAPRNGDGSVPQSSAESLPERTAERRPGHAKTLCPGHTEEGGPGHWGVSPRGSRVSPSRFGVFFGRAGSRLFGRRVGRLSRRVLACVRSR